MNSGSLPTRLNQDPPAADNHNLLWYDNPAAKWVEALPVGNGRLSAMIFGQPANERLLLNDGTLWAGGPYDPVNPEAKEALPQVRQLVADGNYRDPAKLISANIMARPLGQMPRQSVGDLLLTARLPRSVEENAGFDVQNPCLAGSIVRDRRMPAKPTIRFEAQLLPSSGSSRRFLRSEYEWRTWRRRVRKFALLFSTTGSPNPTTVLKGMCENDHTDNRLAS